MTSDHDPHAFAEAVRAVIGAIPKGQVMAYGEVAEAAGHPGAARAVGTLLRNEGGDLPWWRVVRADGSLATGKESPQAERLRAEGVAVHGSRGAVMSPS